MKTFLMIILCIVVFLLGIWFSDPLLNGVNSLFDSDLFITKKVVERELEACRKSRNEMEGAAEKRQQALKDLVGELNDKDYFALTKESLLSTGVPGEQAGGKILLRPPSSEMLLKPIAGDDPMVNEVKEGFNSNVKAMLDVSKGILRQKVATLNVELMEMNTKLQEKNSQLNDKLQEVDAYKKELERQKTQVAQLQGIQQDLNKVVKDLEMKIEGGRLKVNFQGDILFASGSHQLRQEGSKLLETVYPVLVKAMKENDIFVVGHTDNVPIAAEHRKKYDSNWELSTHRAVEVVKYLLRKGLTPANLTAAGFGEHKPVADNASDAGRARNRRVELYVVPRILQRAQ